jgi:hypothetical protein
MVIRKRVFAFALLCLLVASMAELASEGAVKGNPSVARWLGNFPRSPVTEKPLIFLDFTKGIPTGIFYGQVFGTDPLTITFQVIIPNRWVYDFPNYGDAFFDGAITSVRCTLDNETIVTDNAIHGGVPEINNCFLPVTYPMTYNYTQTINPQIGQHTLTIIVYGSTAYLAPYNDGYLGVELTSYDVSNQAIYNFTVYPLSTPTPTLTPTTSPTTSTNPSPSPTQQPTLEISPTPIVNHDSDWIPIAVVALVIVVGISASAVYLKRRKRAMNKKTI